MKKLLSLVLTTLTLIAKSQCVSDFVLNSKSTSDGNTNFTSLAIDNANDLVIVGQFSAGTFMYPGVSYSLLSTSDMIVMKSDDQGNVLWSKSFSSAVPVSQTYPNSIVTDTSNDIYISGYYINTTVFGTYGLAGDGCFLVKLSGMDGSVMWVKKIGNYNSTIVTKLAIDNNRVFVGGGFQDTLLVGTNTLVSNGYYDAFIATYNLSGNFISAKTYGGANSAEALIALSVMPGGDLVAGINYVGSGFTMGTTTLPSFGANDISYSRLGGTSLTPKWTVFTGSNADDFTGDVAFDNNANAYCFSTFSKTVTIGSQSVITNGDKDILLTKIDSSGSVIWSKGAGGTSRDEAVALMVKNGFVYTAATVFENVKISGGINLNNATANVRNSLITKYDLNGNYAGHFLTNDTASNAVYAYSHQASKIVMDASQNIYLTGSFLNRVSFNGKSTNLTGILNSFPNGYLLKLCDNNIVGIYENKKEQIFFSVYPNPASDIIYFTASEALTNVSVTLKDLLGKEVFSGRVESLPLSLNIKQFQSGVYFVTLSSLRSQVTIKIIKE